MVLIAVASKHGSSLEIGEVIGATLRASGLGADVERVEDVAMLDGYAAVVLGSGVYSGHWMRRARDFVDTFESGLARLPVWLFSSGPVGDPPRPLENPAEVISVAERIGSRGHRIFGGKIEDDELRISERALVTLVHAAYGDFRPWSEISDWAEAIAAELFHREQPAAAAMDGHREMDPRERS